MDSNPSDDYTGNYRTHFLWAIFRNTDFTVNSQNSNADFAGSYQNEHVRWEQLASFFCMTSKMTNVYFCPELHNLTENV